MLLLKFIGLLAGQTLQNSALYEEAVTRRRQQEALVSDVRVHAAVAREMLLTCHARFSISSLPLVQCRMMETLTAQQSVDLIITQLIAASYQLLDVDRISLFIVEQEKNVLVCKVNKDASLVGCKVPLHYGKDMACRRVVRCQDAKYAISSHVLVLCSWWNDMFGVICSTCV